MPKLKPVSGLSIVKALGKAGFQVVGRKGSHVRLKKILRRAGLTAEELSKFLEE